MYLHQLHLITRDLAILIQHRIDRRFHIPVDQILVAFLRDVQVYIEALEVGEYVAVGRDGRAETFFDGLRAEIAEDDDHDTLPAVGVGLVEGFVAVGAWAAGG